MDRDDLRRIYEEVATYGRRYGVRDLQGATMDVEWGLESAGFRDMRLTRSGDDCMVIYETELDWQVGDQNAALILLEEAWVKDGAFKHEAHAVALTPDGISLDFVTWWAGGRFYTGRIEVRLRAGDLRPRRPRLALPETEAELRGSKIRICREVFDFCAFYALGDRFERGGFRVHTRSWPPGHPLDLTRGEAEPQEPVRFYHDEGSRIQDRIGTTCSVLHLVSDRVVDALEGFSGWRSYPVEIHARDGGLVEGYHGLAVTGRAGPIDDDLSTVLVWPPASPHGEAMAVQFGIRFRPETWDGSDVFMPVESNWVLVTHEVQAALTAAKITGIYLDRITQIELLLSE